MPKVSVYNLGQNGVNVDKSAIHLEDGELSKGQNAVRDVAGVDGGIRKRPGLARFNSTAGAGSIVGGISVPITLEASSINGTTLSGPTRRIYWARSTTGANLGLSQGWWTSDSKFTTAATEVAAVATGGLPSRSRSTQISEWGTGVIAGYNGMPGAAVVVNNRLYYASGDYTIDSTAPVIRRFDGTIDEEFVRIPIDPSVSATIQPQGILSMLAVGTTIYLTVYDDDDGTIGGGTGGRVFKLDSSSGALTQLGAKFVTHTSGADHVPYCLEYHAGRLWTGTYNRQSGAGIAGKIYWIRPGIDTAWTLDRTMASGRGTTFLKSYQGQLYAGSDPASSSTNALVEVRSSVGAWSSSLSVAAGGVYRQFQAAIVFEDALYCSLHASVGNTSTIRKLSGTTWSTAYTTTGGSEDKALTACWSEDGTLFFGSGGADSGNATLVSTDDGSSWTSRAANLTDAGAIGLTGMNCVGVLVV